MYNYVSSSMWFLRWMRHLNGIQERLARYEKRHFFRGTEKAGDSRENNGGLDQSADNRRRQILLRFCRGIRSLIQRSFRMMSFPAGVSNSFVEVGEISTQIARESLILEILISDNIFQSESFY